MSAVPPNEAERLAELRRYEILDSGPEPLFDHVVSLAGDLLHAPIALISLIDEKRVWFKARHGLTIQQVDRDSSLCVHALTSDDVFQIHDLLNDPRTAKHPLVTGEPAIRFYAAAPIRGRRGHKLGVLCVMDVQTRTLTEKEESHLTLLAEMVSSQLELRRAARQLDKAEAPQYVSTTPAPDASLQQEREVFKAGPTVVFKWKAQEGWPVEYVSPNVEQFGYTADEFMSGKIVYSRIVHPDDLRRVEAEVSAYSKSDVDCFNQEYRICRRNGEVRWIYDFTVMIRDAQKQITHYHGYVIDTTERKKAEEAVRDSWAKYQAMIDAFDGLIYICSADYKVEFMNRRLIERTGYNAIGEDCFKALHQRENICPWCVNESVLRGKTVRWEVLSPKDNRWYYVVNTPIHRTDGRVSKMAMIQDVTERKQAEEALKRREAVLEAVAFASDQLMKTTDWGQCVQEVLSRLGQATGVSRVYIFENEALPNDEILATRRFEWTAPGTASLLYNPEMYSFRLRERGLVRWADMLARRQVIDGHVREFPETERDLLTRHGIRSALVVPIFVEQAFWGFIGFDSCTVEREWSTSEIDVLKTAAGLLGTAIIHQRAEEALRSEKNTAQQYLNIAGVMLVAIAADQTVSLINRKGCEILGYRPEDIVGRNWFDLVVPAPIREEVRSTFNDLLSGRLSLAETYENCVVTKAGLERSILWHNTVIRDEAGKIIATLSSGEDISERKKSEAQFRKLSSAVNQTADSIMITDRKGVIEYVNPAFERMTGYTREEVIGKTPAILKSGHQDAAFYKTLWDTILRGDVFRGEFVNRKKNGLLYSQGETITPIKDETGKVTHFVSSGRDITERVAAQNALKESEQRLAGIISFLPDATFAVDRAGKVIAWNRAMEVLSGVKAADMLGHGNYEYALPFYGARRPILIDLVTQSNPEAERSYAYVERVGDTLIAEVFLPHVKRDGIHVWVKATPLYDAHGNIVGAIECIRDVSEQKRSEESIRKLAAFPQFNPNPVLEFTAEGTLSYFNRAAKEMAISFGKENPLDILPIDTPEIVRQCLAQNQSRLRVEMKMGDRTLSWSYFPVAESNTVHAYGGDITERVNLEAQMRHLQKMDAVGRLAGGVAHDFNNILTAILGYSSMLLLEKNLDPGVMEQLREISKAAERASRLTRQLLTFSRKQVLQPKVLNLNDVLTSLNNMLRSLISEDVALDVELQPDLPLLYADQTMIEQVLVNLVINARDAMPQGGRLTVSTCAVNISDTQVRGNPEAKQGRFVLLSVSDTGVGISKDLQAQIFEPFFTTKPSGKGTGLGLATVYGIVKQHNGWVEVESEEDRGSTFNVFLPVHEGAAASAGEPKHPKLPAAGGTETILVVEDEPTVRVLACSVLTQYGYRVLEASSGAEGVAAWEREHGKIDLLLTDVVMPGGMTGTELADQLTQRRKDLKVLLTSGYRVDSLGQKAPIRKGYRFLPKPFSPEELARKVRQCIDGK